ncbi:MAG: hypothetical protein LBV72_12595 [Tannerella sp.]|nr:hypothetical protein [Tannerella sp.]
MPAKAAIPSASDAGKFSVESSPIFSTLSMSQEATPSAKQPEANKYIIFFIM